MTTGIRFGENRSGIQCAYRVTQPHEIGLFSADFLQVSVFRRWPNALETMLKTVDACRSANIRYVIHPVEYSLCELRPEHRRIIMDDLHVMALHTDLALIIHDESTQAGKRLTNEAADAYRQGLAELSRLCVVSIENAGANKDVKWFWREYAESITLDIGHLEIAGIDSVDFVATLEPDLLEAIDFVHLHRVNGLRGGIRDHWGLTEGCRELRALEELLARKKGLRVILEIIEAEDLEKSLNLLRSLSSRKITH
jgi:sugar phosphate isomerase/epimerase